MAAGTGEADIPGIDRTQDLRGAGKGAGILLLVHIHCSQICQTSLPAYGSCFLSRVPCQSSRGKLSC